MIDEARVLTPAQCVALLREAQCGTSADASRALRDVERGQESPHPTVTAAALELLEVHPGATIAYLPGVISASASDVVAVVEAFGELLPSDRTLLVPMLGALGDMPLSKAHETAARATLRYALRTVDENDIPTVARALLRCARTTALARSAVNALTDALAAEPSPHIASLIAGVAAEHARARSPVGRALRMPTNEASAAHIAVWAVCLHRARTAFDAIGDAALTAVRASARSGALLAVDPPVPTSRVQAASRVLSDAPHGAAALVSAIVAALPDTLHASEAGILSLFVRAVVSECPSAMNPIIAELSRVACNTGARASAAESALLAIDASTQVVPIVAVSAALRNITLRNELFVRMRKALVFGTAADRSHACQIALVASRMAHDSMLREMVDLMHSVVPTTLIDPTATAFLLILAAAGVRGVVDHDRAGTLLEQRLVVPSGFFGPRNEKGGIQIDLAAIQHGNAGAVTAVVSAGLALTCVQIRSGTKSVASKVVMASVLVPVVCLPLYEAAQIVASSGSETKQVDDDDNDDDDGEYKRAEHLQKLDKLSSVEFKDALEGCIATIAALIGVLNTASIALAATRRILQVRHELNVRYADGAMQDDMWAVLERASELVIMMEAVSFACAQHIDADDASDTSSVEVRNLSTEVQKQVEGIVIANKYMHIDQETVSAEELNQFPVLSLDAIIALLVAIPDEKALRDLEHGVATMGKRDSELVRIEQFVFRHLLWLVCIEWRESVESKTRQNVQTENCNEQMVSENKLKTLLQRVQEVDDDSDDIFLVDSKMPDRKERRRAHRAHWANPLCMSRENVVVDRTCTQKYVLYTPELAALLVDRAATCVAAASAKRSSARNVNELKALSTSAACALRVFTHVVQNAPVLSNDKRAFVSRIAACMVANAPATAATSSETNCVVGVMEWIARASIDLVVALIALDALAVLGEYGAACANTVRELALTLSNQPREYGERALLHPFDTDALFVECTQTWLTRRRRARCAPQEDGPWLTLDPIYNAQFIPHHRLVQLLNVLRDDDVAREVCARAEALAEALETDPHAGDPCTAAPALPATTATAVYLRACTTALSRLRGDDDEGLCTRTVVRAYHWTRALNACVRCIITLRASGAHLALPFASALQAARSCCEAQMNVYSSPRTSVTDMSQRVLACLRALGDSLGGCAKHGNTLANALKTRSYAGAMTATRGAAHAMRAKSAVPRILDAADAARRTSTTVAKEVRRAPARDAIAVGDGIRAWHARKTDNECVDIAQEDSDVEVEQVQLPPQPEFHSTNVGEPGRDTVFISFRNTRD